MIDIRRLSLVAVIGVALAGCGGSDEKSPADIPKIEDPGPIHVHGLGVNPVDGALFIATHTGLFRTGEDEQKARRVGDRYQDTMGFTVVGPNRFLGSGHPDGRDRLPPFLGLIRSTDAGRSWRPVSLLGKSDFHVLEAAGRRVVGFGTDFRTRAPRFLVSDNAGRSWRRREAPEPLIDLAIDPEDADRFVAAGESGLYGSSDAGRTWASLPDEPGLLGWRGGELFRVGRGGDVSVSENRGRSFRPAGEIGGRAAAFQAERQELYAALHDGTIKRSADDGRSWAVRSRP